MDNSTGRRNHIPLFTFFCYLHQKLIVFKFWETVPNKGLNLKMPTVSNPPFSNHFTFFISFVFIFAPVPSFQLGDINLFVC